MLRAAGIRGEACVDAVERVLAAEDVEAVACGKVMKFFHTGGRLFEKVVLARRGRGTHPEVRVCVRRRHPSARRRR